MATKKPAVSTQLKQALAKIEELEKKVASAEQSQKWAADRARDADNELDQIHAFLDAVPGAISRDAENYKKHSAMTRLAAWLSVRN